MTYRLMGGGGNGDAGYLGGGNGGTISNSTQIPMDRVTDLPETLEGLRVSYQQVLDQLHAAREFIVAELSVMQADLNRDLEAIQERSTALEEHVVAEAEAQQYQKFRMHWIKQGCWTDAQIKTIYERSKS